VNDSFIIPNNGFTRIKDKQDKVLKYLKNIQLPDNITVSVNKNKRDNKKYINCNSNSNNNNLISKYIILNIDINNTAAKDEYFNHNCNVIDLNVDENIHEKATPGDASITSMFQLENEGDDNSGNKINLKF